MIPAFVGAEPLRVFVSVLPQKTFVERVGGQHVRVQAMVNPGHSPATYAPTPRQVTALAYADLYVRTGVPFENAWMARIRSANPAMRVLDARVGLDLRTLEHQDDDPHIWTSPLIVKRMVRNIRDTLSELMPAYRDSFDVNYQSFIVELDAVDQEIRTLLSDLSRRRFMVFHPAWGYFADTYNLVQIPIETEGKEPGARALTALIEQARREGVKIIFVQPQFDNKLANRVALAIGGRVEVLDPLSPNYIDNLRRVARHIADADRM
jgi:zinc transport system substrate-binding protein